MGLSDDQFWWQQFRASRSYRRFQPRPIAYFCAEFALDPQLPFYAGGLGVLAADVVREASDQRLPMVAVGTYYHGQAPVAPPDAGLARVVDGVGRAITVNVPLGDRHVRLQAWRFDGAPGVPVYLVTTDIPENSPQDRLITERLYPADKERRLQQQIILGVGGLRLLEAAGIHPLVYHLNEGHSAFLALEIISHEMRERAVGFHEAIELARGHIVFTNHTLVAAGQDVYSNDMVAAYLSHLAEELNVPVQELVKIGLVQETSLFSMTMLSLRMASRVNAVSKLHARKAAEIWADHPMVGITNGIHIATWDKLLTQGAKLKGQNSSSDLWLAHQQNKQLLLDQILEVTGKRWPVDTLLLGWARRIVGYKRPLALFGDLGKFLSLSQDDARPVRLVISGSVQAGDEEGEKLFSELLALVKTRLSATTAYLADYNVELARLLTAGCDVWLNTPVVGFEACGTSSMKAALNGGLPCTTKDGWADEVEMFGVGWVVDSDHVSDSLYQIIGEQIAPRYYQRQNGVPTGWLSHMANARQMVELAFGTTRMLREYVEKLYLLFT